MSVEVMDVDEEEEDEREGGSGHQV